MYPIKLNQSLYLFLFVLLFGACQDVISIDLNDGETQLVVDAWINDKPETQVIKLRQTSPYFEAVASPIVRGATITVTDSDGLVFPFSDEDGDGNYTWEPPTGTTFGSIGKEYQLLIQLDGVEYTSSSKMNRIMPVDSIIMEDREKELGRPAGLYGNFYARDLVGLGDAYWIKTFKNGNYLNKPQEITIAYDAGLSVGAQVDGLILIPPIRENMNRIPDSGSDATDDADTPPWAVGDSVLVEIHSLTEEAFYYLERARVQLTLGDATIFAEPPANIPTNILTTNADENPRGFFNVSAVSSLGIKVE